MNLLPNSVRERMNLVNKYCTHGFLSNRWLEAGAVCTFHSRRCTTPALCNVESDRMLGIRPGSWDDGKRAAELAESRLFNGHAERCTVPDRFVILFTELLVSL